MSKENGKTRKDIEEILDTSCPDKGEITKLLEQALTLKTTIDTDTALLDEVKEKLSDLQAQYGFKEGMRHGHIAFVLSFRPGRKTVDSTKLAEELVGAGVKPAVVKDCFKKATKEGKPYEVKEVVDLNKPKGGKRGGEWG